VQSGSTGSVGPNGDGGTTGSGFLQDVLGAVSEQVEAALKPEAVEAVAKTFSFPLALAVVVVLFLLLQKRLDDRDPKLRYAPRSSGEAYLVFEDEDR
jgi:hypothetical protein